MDLRDGFNHNSPDGDRQEEQAVIIRLQFPIGKLENKRALAAIFDLGNIFKEVIEASGLGMYNGHETRIDQDVESVTFYMYGSNANSIYHMVKPILQSLPSLQEVSIIKRYSHFEGEQFTQ